MAIVASQGDGIYAASVCDDLVIGEYSDWFLPSFGELTLMYENLHLSALGDFQDAPYWSSTELDLENATGVMFLNGESGDVPKQMDLFNIRAAREF